MSNIMFMSVVEKIVEMIDEVNNEADEREKL